MPLIEPYIDYRQSLKSITYAELRELYDTSSLVDGASYRITDYDLTLNVNMPYIKSAEHKFDIIVHADSSSELNEKASACLNSDVTSKEYFKYSDLSKWELKYNINNDITKYNWAKLGQILYNGISYNPVNDVSIISIDSNSIMINVWTNGGRKIGIESPLFESGKRIYEWAKIEGADTSSWNDTQVDTSILTNQGKGVIYYMKDDHDNVCGYDFKNLLIYGKQFNQLTTGNYPLVFPNDTSLEDNGLYYTFAKCQQIMVSGSPADGNCYLPVKDIDQSVIEKYFPYNNVIENQEWHGYTNNGLKLSYLDLPYNIIASCETNDVKYRTFSNYFKKTATSNIINNSRCNEFESFAHYNYLGNNDKFNHFGCGVLGCLLNNNCILNEFGYDNNGLFLGEECQFNIFGNKIYDITLGEIIKYCKFDGNNKNIELLKNNEGGSQRPSAGYANNLHISYGVKNLKMRSNATLSATNQIQNFSFETSGPDETSSYEITLTSKDLNHNYMTRYMHREDDIIVCGSLQYLTFECVYGDVTVQLVKGNSDTTVATGALQYRVYDALNYTYGEFQTMENSTLSMTQGMIIQLVGNGVYSSSTTLYYHFKFNGAGNIKASGNIMSLINKEMSDALPSRYCFYKLFYNQSKLLTSPELTATKHKVSGKSIEGLSDYCYSNMFCGCTNLTQAPALPATTLASSCYSYMFLNCTNLSQAPALPATTLAGSCYFNMFYGCTNLTQAPALPATTLASSCYSYMFLNCTNLSQAPALPANTLVEDCYRSMFYGCTNLTQAPALPATTLVDSCYYLMFFGCTNLSFVKVLFTIWNLCCTTMWLNSVNSTGIFICPEALDTTTIARGGNTIPDGWTILKEGI